MARSPLRGRQRPALWWRLGASLALAAAVTAACGTDDGVDAARASVDSSSAVSAAVPAPTPPPRPASDSETTMTTTTAIRPGSVRPEWLGTRVLPLRSDGLGEIRPTPPALVDRAFPTIDRLPPPTTDTFTPTIASVPAAVVDRSTWTPACPVGLEDLRYVTLPFWGFDGELHTGELVVNVDAVDAIVAGFSTLFARQFPIEEMVVTPPEALDAPPTGDGNGTGAFVCRPSVGTTSWSQHAYGRAVDINPFQNPYVKGDIVIPELASAFVDRAQVKPGMLRDADVVGFETVGWVWGARWRSSTDTMHLSANGR